MESEWIKVSDRLPETPQHVIIYADDCVIPDVFYGDGKFYFQDYISYEIYDPTHWMPLPKPPTE